ncbi:DALR anticodon-binding domain-containing protein [Aliinostoc sp. HNIBRCY26]|uniref:DALR anticodon-binding domain-containing protein n=1 Tax=Aliinostoc sp. HNIBRCY26 TaxID=3418997 RepID=UPI003CFCD6E3
MSKNTAIKHLINSYLIVAVDTYISGAGFEAIKNIKIPLYKGRDANRVLYISGVALQLAKSHNSVTEEIASAIAQHIFTTSGGTLLTRIVTPGWVHIEVTHHLLADWLQSIAFGSSKSYFHFLGLKLGFHNKSDNRQTENSSRLFTIQYAHARCYSLILLAHREGLITGEEKLPASGESVHLGSLVKIEDLPWLNSDRKLHLHQPSEIYLIMELIKAVDELECAEKPGQVNWEKIAWDVSQAFLNFWSQCRIWGEVKTNSPELTQARLGLVMATQCVLRVLLIGKLGVDAPVEL